MIRIIWFVVLVFGLGCGEVVPEPVVVDQGYSMRVQCVVPPKNWEGPCEVDTSCTSYQRDGGIYRVTFCQTMIDSLTINCNNWYCDSLPILDFESKESFDLFGSATENAIMCGIRGKDYTMDRGDTLHFYINLDKINRNRNEGFTLNSRTFWIDSAGVDVVYELWFYNPISRGYGFRRKNTREWR